MKKTTIRNLRRPFKKRWEKQLKIKKSKAQKLLDLYSFHDKCYEEYNNIIDNLKTKNDNVYTNSCILDLTERLDFHSNQRQNYLNKFINLNNKITKLEWLLNSIR